jgi:hypothetical protein
VGELLCACRGVQKEIEDMPLFLEMTMELIECGTIGKEEDAKESKIASGSAGQDKAKKYSWAME